MHLSVSLMLVKYSVFLSEVCLKKSPAKQININEVVLRKQITKINFVKKKKTRLVCFVNESCPF